MSGRALPSLLALLALALALALPGASESREAGDDARVRLGVVSFYNARLMFVRYQPLVDFLSDRTGRRWELAVSASYEQATDDLCAGRVTLAHLGPLTYVRARARCGAVSFLRLQTRGGSAIHGDVLVRSDSPFERLEDLAGHRIGFGDPLSTSSHLLPRAMLQEAGLNPGEDLECHYFGQHELAARAVLMGEVEACGVRDTVGDLFLHRGLRRLARSAPVPGYPLVVSPGTPEDLREALTAALLDFPGEDRPPREETRSGLELKGDFVGAEDADYDPVRQLALEVFGPDYARRPPEDLRCR